jgi:hypothetical protein
MSAYKIQTLGNHPEESRQLSEHSESLKSRILGELSTVALMNQISNDFSNFMFKNWKGINKARTNVEKLLAATAVYSTFWLSLLPETLQLLLWCVCVRATSPTSRVKRWFLSMSRHLYIQNSVLFCSFKFY